jgi:hypothetical protein
VATATTACCSSAAIFDELSRPVNDNVSIRWDRNLQRYEFTALQWDTANQEFVVGESVVSSNLTLPTSVDTAWQAIDFQLRVPGTDGTFQAIHVDAFFGKMPAWRALIQAALDARFGAGTVEVEDIEGVLRLRASGDGLELRADPANAVVTQLGFTPLSAARPLFAQDYAFFRTQGVESIVLDLRAGDDTVHANPEYKFPNTNSEWGIKRGNLQEGARLGGLTILGGAGDDRLFGGEQDDTIDGGEGDDIIFGYGGSDSLTGGGGNDLISGYATLEPDEYEFGTSEGVRGRNDISTYASVLPAIRAGSVIDGLNFHLGDTGDWYAIRTPESLNALGESAKALLTKDMFEVVKTRRDVNGVWQEEPFQAKFFLFAAENTGTVDAPKLQPRGSFSGVPDHYLLHVVNEFTPAVTTDEVEYRIRVKAPLGATTAVDASLADVTLSATALGGQPVYIPLGDIDGDRFEDAVVSILDNVFDSTTGTTAVVRDDRVRPGGRHRRREPHRHGGGPHAVPRRERVQPHAGREGRRPRRRRHRRHRVRRVRHGATTAPLQGAYVLFGRSDWEPVVDLTSATFADSRNVFIRVASGPVSVSGIGNMADFYGLGMRSEFFDLSETANTVAIPEVADGKFLRNDSDSGRTVLTLTDLPAHDLLDLEFLLAAIGAWGANGPDQFNVTVDGVSVFSRRIDNSITDPLAYVAPAGGLLIDREDRGFGLAVDSLFDMGAESALKSIAHTGSTVTIEFFADGDGWTGGTIESFALDHVRVAVGTSGSDARAVVFSSDLDGGRPVQFTGAGTVQDVGGFGPTIVRTEADAFAIGDLSNVDGVTGLGAQYLLRWSGQILSPGATSIDLYIGGDERVRFVLNGVELVADTADRGSVELLGLDALTQGHGRTLAGFNSFRYEMLNRTGNSVALLAYDADPGAALSLRLLSDINGDGDATTADTLLWRTSAGLSDLMISSGEKLRYWGGRDRAEWIADARINNTGGADDPDLVPRGDASVLPARRQWRGGHR